MSLPLPPDAVSLPSPPNTLSCPFSPYNESAPSPPSRMSSPLPAVIVSLALVPVSTSFLFVPAIVAMVLPLPLVGPRPRFSRQSMSAGALRPFEQRRRWNRRDLLDFSTPSPAGRRAACGASQTESPADAFRRVAF